MKKRIIAAFLLIALLLVAVSCENGNENTTATESTGKPQGQPVIEGTILKNAVGLSDENGLFTVPDGITLICEGCFAGDENIRSVVMPASVTAIGSSAFYGCTTLSSVTMTDSVTSIGSQAFMGCTSLEEIVLPPHIDKINSESFSYCTSLERIDIPEGVKLIDSAAFAGCTMLDTVVFPKSLTSIGTAAFSGCKLLDRLKGFEESSITSIGSGAFSECTSIRKIKIPGTVTTIESQAFNACTGLSEVEIPDSVTSIGAFAFTSTPWYKENTEKFLVVGDGVLIRCTLNPNSLEEPGTLDLNGLGIKSIGNTCFVDAYDLGYDTSEGYKYCAYIRNVIIPEGVTTIGAYAFFGCINIENLTLPSTLETIGTAAFYGSVSNYYSYLSTSFENCKNLKSIGGNAFYGCSGIKEVVIPDNCKYIGDSAFTETEAFYRFVEESQELGKGNQYKMVGDHILLWVYVAKGEKTVTVPEGTKYVAGGACVGWDSAVVYDDPENNPMLSEAIKVKYRVTNNVEQLIIPDGVEYIGEYAFATMKSIQSVVIPDSVKTIASGAFTFCSHLNSVTLGKNVEEIGGYAFSYTTIPDIKFPESLKTIGSSAFISCTRLTYLEFPSGIVSVGSTLVDKDCIAMTAIYIPEKFRPVIMSIADFSNSNAMLYYLP